MIALVPVKLKNEYNRLQNFESEISDIVPNDFDREHPIFADKNTQIIDSLNITHGLLCDPTVKVDNLDPMDRHQSNRSTMLDTYNPKAGTNPSDTAPCLSPNQYFSQRQPHPSDGTDASGSNYTNWTSTPVPLITQTYGYIEARPSRFLQCQLGANWENTSATVATDNTFPTGITDEQMAELFGSPDIGFSQNEGSFNFEDLL